MGLRKVVLHDDEYLASACIDRVWVCRWWKFPAIAGRPHGGGPQMISASLGQAERVIGSKFAVLVVVAANTPSPDSALRAELARLVKKYEPAYECSAYVVEGEGFQAAAIRGLVTGVMLLARSAAPTKVFASVSDAARWFAPRIGADAAALDAELSAYCARRPTP